MEYIHAALLLHKLGQDVSEEKLKKVIAASGAEVDESKVKVLVASLKGVDIDAELANAGNIAMSSGSSAGASAPAKEEKKEEEIKPEAAAEGLSSLFG